MNQWFDGLVAYYAQKRRSLLGMWAVGSLLIVVCWLTHALPFVFIGVVTNGNIIEVRCSSRGYAYSYNYQVDGHTYVGQSGWGGIDGNGSCSRLGPGAQIAITYQRGEPSMSMGGTVSAWNKALTFFLVFFAIAFLIFMPVVDYAKERRRRPAT